MITAERLRSLLSYDKDTGIFVWAKNSGSRAKAGAVAGSRMAHGYWEIGVDGERHLGHRLAFLYVNGRWPDKHIDHINGDKADNRIDNLRECTPSQNLSNIGMRSYNRSGIKGVHWDKGTQKWRVQLSVGDKTTHIGVFSDKDEACRAYRAAALNRSGDFARFL